MLGRPAGRRPAARRLLLLLAGVTLTWVWALVGAAPAQAHARLDGADPAAGATLAAAPGAVRLHFDEQISPQFSQIQVLDRGHHEVSVPPATLDGADKGALRVPMQSPLHNGTYTVLWRVVSATDGHVTQGSYAFILQQAGAAADVAPAAGGAAAGDAAQPLGDNTPPPPPLRWFWRALALIGAAGLLGAPLFSSLIIGALPREEIAALALPLGRRLAALLVALGGVVLLALGADMLYQVASLGGTDALAAFGSPGLAGQVITTTGYGAFWALKIVAVLALVGYALWRRQSAAQAEWPAAVLNAGFLFAGEALGSHEAAARNIAGLPLGMAGDLVHLLAAGAWIGGLLYLAVVLLPVLRRGDPVAGERLLGHVVPRFSNLALISVAVLLVSGLANLALHTLDPGAIVDSAYGRVLILKHLLFLPLLALGAVNNQVLRPRFVATLLPGADASGGWLARRFGRIVGIEVVLGLAVLACAAGLTLLPPPVAAAPAASPAQSAGPQPPAAPATPVVARGSDTVRGVRFDLEARPAAEGDLFTLTLTRVDPATLPLTDVLKLQVKVIPQDFDAGSLSLMVGRVGAAGPDRQVYTATGQVLTLSGSYQVTAELLRTQSDDLRAGFHLALADDGALDVTRSPVLRAIVTTRPSPPLTGTAELIIKVLDGVEQPVPDASVKLTPLMPAHGHVEPLTSATPLAGQPGVYRATVRLPMGGAWLLIIEIARSGQPPVKVDASFDVIDPYATPLP